MKRVVKKRVVEGLIIVLLAPVYLVIVLLAFAQYGRVFYKSSRVRTRKAVLRAPGHRLQRVLAFLFPKKSFETHFAPIIADMREEAFELDAEGKVWERRWKVVWYHVALIYSVAAVLVFGVLKKAVKLWQGV